MNILQHLFVSKVRIKILEHFIFHPGEAFYVRNVAEIIDEPVGSVARELLNLEKAEILISKKVGNQKHYSLDKNNPILDDLTKLFLKTSGVTQEIKSALQVLPGIELAFIYGSYAKGDAKATSDLDMMLITELSDKRLAVNIAKIERQLKREINYNLYSRAEANKRMGERGDFLYEVFSGPHIIIIGSQEDELFKLSE